MANQLTHYRKVYKSDHLGVADLEDYQEGGSKLIFTISHVKQETNAKVAGKKMNANIAYFNDGVKPLVLNSTNAATLRKMTNSGFIENWAGITIQLYIDKNVRMMGEVVGGIRINPNPPKTQKPQLIPESPGWAGAKKAFIRDGNYIKVLERVDMTEAHMAQMQQEANQGV